jgi:Family of unknown function (DUF6279)
MITTFNTMLPSALPRSRARSPIIAALVLVLVVALAGCSLLKLGYGQASPLAFRWLDGYVDFDDAQSLRVKTALDEAMAWHRRSQLPDYVELLVRAEAEVTGEATPERMCAWAKELRARVDPALQYVAPTIAEVALTLTPQQIAHVEKHFAETNDEWRDEHLQRDLRKRKRAALAREVERAETLYGRLDEAQRELVSRALAASPYEPERHLAERQRRQQEALALIRRLRETNASRDEAVAQVRAYLHAIDRSPRDSHQAYADRLASHNCAFASELHNATSATQRLAAVKKLKGYESDLRALIAEAAS